MAGPLQGPAAGSLDRTPYGTGRGAAGGKIRPVRHYHNPEGKPGAGVRKGPYDRPVGRNPPQPAARRGAWSGVGSRILNGASSFFSSFFRKDDGNLALPAPPPSQSYQEDAVNHDGNFGEGDQIEDLLKDRAFTREQCDRFIKVLQSKLQPPIANGIVGNRGQLYPDDELEQERGDRQNIVHLDADENGSSPVDIAKAYMDSRLSPVPGSSLPIRTLEYDTIRTHDEYRATPSRVARSPYSHIRIATPGHTPYVRLHTRNARASPYPVDVRPNSYSIEKKRRVDGELDYTGRRTKLKMTPSNGPPLSSLPSASNDFGLMVNYTERMKNLQSKRWEKRKEDVAVPVPMQSSETARKILQTLEILTPPKVKSLEEELAVVREKRPKELSPSMLNEKARKTEQAIEGPVPDAFQQDPSPSHRVEEPASSKGMVLVSNEPATKNVKGKAATNSPEQSSPKPAYEPAVKGFRMNAALEESNSDDDVQITATPVSTIVPETKSLLPIGTSSPATESQPASKSLPLTTVPSPESKSIYTLPSAPLAEKKSSSQIKPIPLPIIITPESADSQASTAPAVSASESKSIFSFSTAPVAEKKASFDFFSSQTTESKVAFSSAAAQAVAETKSTATQAVAETKPTSVFGFSATATDSKPAFISVAAESKSAFALPSAPVAESKTGFEFLPSDKKLAILSAASFSSATTAAEIKPPPLFEPLSSGSDSKRTIAPVATPAISVPQTEAAFVFSSAPVGEKNTGFEFISSQASKPALPLTTTSSVPESKSAQLFGISNSTASPVVTTIPAAESKPSFTFSSAPAVQFGVPVTTSAPFTFGSNASLSSSINFGISPAVPSSSASGTSSATSLLEMENNMDAMAEEPASITPVSQPPVFGNTPSTTLSQPFVFSSPTTSLFGASSTFGTQQASSPAFGTFGSQSFGSQTSLFGAPPASTAAPAQPFVFGSPQPQHPPAFGATTSFGTQQTPAPSFPGFGSQPFGSQPLFGGQQPSAAAPEAPVFGAATAGNPFSSGFSGFTVGSGNAEGEQRTRKIFKAKRTGASKRGK